MCGKLRSLTSGLVRVLTRERPDEQLTVGYVFVALAAAAFFFYEAVCHLRHGQSDGWSALGVGVLLVGLACATPFIMRRILKKKVGCCEKCGYDLTGNVSGRCPECGRELPDRDQAVAVSHPPERE